MPAPSLLDMVKRRLQRSVDLVVDVGDIPFHVLETVLKKIENPKQLREIEANSPHIAEDTGPLWLNFIKRDIQNWEQKPHEPRNPTSWCKVYYKLRREQEEEIVRQQEALRAALAKTEQERKKNTSTLLNGAFDPVQHRRMHTTSGPSLTRDPRNYTYMPGESKKRLTGRGIMAKIQHQAQASLTAKKSNSPMNVPTHLLGSRTKTMTAPPSMIAQKTRAPQPIDRGKQAPSRTPFPSRSASTPSDTVRKQREEAEARLRALTNGTTLPPSAKKTDGAGGNVTTGAQATAPAAAGSVARPLKRKAETNCLRSSKKK